MDAAPPDETPSLALRAALGALEGEAGVEVLSDWTWCSPWWAAPLRLTVTAPALRTVLSWGVQETTEWYVAATPIYPWGAVELFPAAEGSIEGTFWHQHLNLAPQEGELWRTGMICTDTILRSMGRHGHGADTEPHTVTGRLRWKARRARAWIAAAAAGDLVRDGERFELPPFASSLALSVVSGEHPGTLAEWSQSEVRVGTVELARLSEGSAPLSTVVTGTFRALDGSPLVRHRWGTALESLLERSGHQTEAAWIRLSAPPVLPPYGTPVTWGELRAVGGDEFARNLDALVPRLRGAQAGTPLLVGFPIPKWFGGPLDRLHWQPLGMPAIPKRISKLPVGGRAHLAQERKILGSSRPAAWGEAESGARDQVAERGRFARSLSECSVTLLGAGALGSTVGDLLVRGGVEEATVVDPELFEVGNARRHTLGVGDAGRPKAVALAERLNASSPHARVTPIVGRYPDLEGEGLAQVHGSQLVIDCTSSDAVLPHLEDAAWGGLRLFVSLSLGFEARRGYAFVAHAQRFPHDQFRNAIGPWLLDENAELEAAQLPRQIGCWHPIFPARVDHVWLMGSALVGLIEGAISAPPARPQLVVLERQSGPLGSAIIHEAALPQATDTALVRATG